MPSIYLSPSTQEYNPYVGGGSEEYYMNLIADAMVPYLEATGITYNRNTPDMTAGSSISESNSGNYDFHLALHSNAVGAQAAGSVRGSQVYYYPYSANSERAAEIFVNNLKQIYPIPASVSAIPTTTLGEVARTRAPAVLIEYAFHDNQQDADWIRNNINAIAANTVLSLADYFGIPFVSPERTQQGRVATPEGGALNIRSEPNIYSDIKGTIPDGALIEIYSTTVPEWYVVGYNGIVGYGASQYITLIN